MAEWLNVRQAAKQLKVSERQIEKMIERGEFPSAVRANGKWKISKTDLRKMDREEEQESGKTPRWRTLFQYLSIAVVVISAILSGSTEAVILLFVMLVFLAVSKYADRILVPMLESVDELLEMDEEEESPLAKLGIEVPGQDTIEKSQRWMGLEEAADWLEAPDALVEGLMKEGVFPSAVEEHGEWKVRARDLVQYVQQQVGTNWLVGLFQDNLSLTLLIAGISAVLIIVIGIGVPDLFSKWPIFLFFGTAILGIYAMFRAIRTGGILAKVRKKRKTQREYVRQGRNYSERYREEDEDESLFLRILDMDSWLLFFFILVALFFFLALGNALGLY